MDINTRPYVVINNKDSRLIPGLLISELPPIRKPSIRTKTETIDGKDGDIVTKLGYAAYNKTINIGLTYGYNVDEIISFFSSEGTIIFSNEPEKYYLFSVYDAIDFERLIRFKTAKVVFHVQPFKYPEFEKTKTFEFTDNAPKTFMIRNIGNTNSRPTFSIYGTGEVKLKINGVDILTIDLSSEHSIIIDSQNMNAYAPLGGRLLNRLVSGDYDKIQLMAGNNQVIFTGAVTKVNINHYSRYI